MGQLLCLSWHKPVGPGGISLDYVNLTAQVKEIKFPIKSDTPCVIKPSVHHSHVEYTLKLIRNHQEPLLSIHL